MSGQRHDECFDEPSRDVLETGPVPAASLRPAPGDDMGAWIGRTLAGRVRLVERVASGELGELFRAERLSDGSQLGVRIAWPRGAETAREFQRAFASEARVAMRVRHPHVACVHHYGPAGGAGAMFVEREWLEGHDLAATLAAYGPLPSSQALLLASQVTRALRAAHGLGIVHGDLRASSVFLQRLGRRSVVKLLDFGRPRLSAFSEDLPLGWARYLSPEQIRGEEADERSDVYAVGAVLYQALSGYLPFGETTGIAVWIAQSSEGPVPLTQRCPPGRVSPAVEALVMRCLAPEPSARFPDAASLLQAVDALREA